MTAVAAVPARLDVKLTAHVDKNRQVHAELVVTNNGNRSICFFETSDAVMFGTDGSSLGNPEIIDHIWSDHMNVVWPDGWDHTYDASINSLNGGVLSASEVGKLARLFYLFVGYDCGDLVSRGQDAKSEFQIELTAIPTIDPQ